MGSVKDLTILEPAFENKAGHGRFNFSDRYSVFDWGEMPDHILDKGSSLATMAAFNFEELERRGIRTHYRGLVVDSELQRLQESGNHSNLMDVDMAAVYRPVARRFTEHGRPKIVYDYSFFDTNRGNINNYLVGLEIIFRNALPEGSSVFGKIAKAKTISNEAEREEALQQIYQSLGLTSDPKPGDFLPKPIMNYTTKLEAGDRNLTENDAYKISGLTEENFAKIGPLALKINEVITEQAQKAGMVHYDGKVEMLFNNGLVLGDVLGTFDENRLGFNGEQVSKEFLRQWYKKNQKEFAPACDEWKKTGEGWQERCTVKPVHLPQELSRLVSQLYMAGCNQYVGRKIFQAPELPTVMDQIRPYR